jgi:hypothetical protein
VREEAALDQQTMRICLEKIARCQRLPPWPSLVFDSRAARLEPYPRPAKRLHADRTKAGSALMRRHNAAM